MRQADSYDRTCSVLTHGILNYLIDEIAPPLRSRAILRTIQTISEIPGPSR